MKRNTLSATAVVAIAAALTLTACGPDREAAYQACVQDVTTQAADALDDLVDALNAGADPAEVDLEQVRDVIELVRTADETCGGAR